MLITPIRVVCVYICVYICVYVCVCVSPWLYTVVWQYLIPDCAFVFAMQTPSLTHSLTLLSTYVSTQESITDCNNVLKKKGAKKTKTNHNVRTTVSDDSEVNQRVLHSANILPHHSDMFEKHRLIYMKGILKSVLFAELQYHCQVIEKLSPLFESLALVDENDSDVQSFIREYQSQAFSS